MLVVFEIDSQLNWYARYMSCIETQLKSIYMYYIVRITWSHIIRLKGIEFKLLCRCLCNRGIFIVRFWCKLNFIEYINFLQLIRQRKKTYIDEYTISNKSFVWFHISFLAIKRIKLFCIWVVCMWLCWRACHIGSASRSYPATVLFTNAH